MKLHFLLSFTFSLDFKPLVVPIEANLKVSISQFVRTQCMNFLPSFNPVESGLHQSIKSII